VLDSFFAAAAVWVLVGVFSVIAGIALAIHKNRPKDGYFLRQGVCAECRSKSLLCLPTGPSANLFECEDCGAQWLVRSVSGLQDGIRQRSALPQLRFSFGVERPDLVFEADRARVVFADDLFACLLSTGASSPRELLQATCEHDILPAEIHVDDSLLDTDMLLEYTTEELLTIFYDYVGIQKKDQDNA